MKRIETLRSLTLVPYGEAAAVVLAEVGSCLETRIDADYITAMDEQEFADLCDELHSSYPRWIKDEQEEAL